MQWRTPMVRAIHRLVAVLGPSGDDSANVVHASRRDGRVDVVPRAVSQEIVYDVASRLAEAGGPPDYLELVAVAAADGIRAMFDQQLDDRELLFLGREMERHRVVAFVADV